MIGRFTVLMTAIVMLLSLQSRTVANTVPDWLSHSCRRVVIGADPHNADKMMAQIREVHDCGADTVILTSHLWGQSFFPSKMASQSPTLTVKDVVADGTRMAHKLGMRAVFYVGAPYVQQSLKDRIDWRQRDPSGNPSSDDPRCCMLSPFGDWEIEFLTEIAKHAPIDGLWLDGYPQMPLWCSCHYCSEAYKREKGFDLPTSASEADPAFRRYVAWWHGKCLEHARRLVAAIHSVSPQIAVFYNSVTGRQPDDWRTAPYELCSTLDSPSVEQFWQVDHQGDPLQALFTIDMTTAATEGKPSEVFIPLYPHMVDCTTALPRVESLLRTFTVIADGSVPQLSYPLGRQDTFAELISEIRKREPYLIGARRARYCAIAASSLTAMNYGRDKSDPLYWDEVKGWLRALVETHAPVELLTDKQLDEGKFDGLKVLILPKTACLSDAAQRRIRAFVKAGGGLIATSVASLANHDGDLNQEFALADLFGAHFERLDHVGPLPLFMPIHPQDHPLAKGDWVDKAVWRQWSALGHEIGSVGLPGYYTAIHIDGDRHTAWSYSNNSPAIITGSVVRGRVVYVGPEIGAAYYRESYPYLRSMMSAAALWAAASPPRDVVSAPKIIQATFFEQKTPNGGTRRVIHLLNDISSLGRVSLPSEAFPIRDEVIPIGGIHVRISGPVTRVHLEPEGRNLKVRKLSDGGLDVALPPLELHSMVVVETR
jgi:hypothetical protein